MRRRIRHIAPRLILLLTVALVLVEGSFGIFNVGIAERNRIDQAVQEVDQLSRSIVAATWHAMMADRKSDAYEVMKSIADRQRIQSIRLFTPDGETVFTTDPADAATDGGETDCRSCHLEAERGERISPQDRARIQDGPNGERRLAMVTTIPNEPSCSTAACHAHDPEEKVLGVLEVTSALSGLDAELAALSRRAMWMSLIHIAIFGVLIFLFTRHFVGRPIRKLIDGTRAVAAADLDQPIEFDSKTELGELAVAFNAMLARLKSTRDELQQFTHSLEEKVEARSRELGAAHEKLIRSDRLASLGQLAASVAHEINNPVGGILNLSMLLRRILRANGIPADRVEEFRGYLARISLETERVGRIVSDLLAFARHSAPQRTEAHLDRIVSRTLALLAHKLELGRIEMVLDFAPDFPLEADPSQLEQVALNLIMNAAEAMPDGGSITIRTGFDADRDEHLLEVEDEGTGIPAYRLSRIFDPFFTTKEEGTGVGLGLSVVYGIVQAHGGHIDVRSVVGSGTVFTVRLPRDVEAPAERDAEGAEAKS